MVNGALLSSEAVVILALARFGQHGDCPERRISTVAVSLYHIPNSALLLQNLRRKNGLISPNSG